MVNGHSEATPQSGSDGARSALTSAMVDGEVSPQEALQWQALWASGAGEAEQARQDWVLYQAIGESLRAPPPDRSGLDPVWRSGPHSLAQSRERAARIQAAVLKEAAAAPKVIPLPRRPRTRLSLAVAAAVTGFLVVGAAFFTTRIDTEAPNASGDWMAWTRLGSNPTAGIGAGLQWSAPPAAAPAWGTSPVAATAQQPAMGAFREILRLPQGPAERPFEVMQVLYSDGVNTISVHIQPSVPGARQPYAQRSERLNALGVQRDGAWLTLSGDVPPAVLQQFAAVLPLAAR